MPARPLPRPFVTANFAVTWDARISTRRGTAANFSSPRDKRRLLEIRAECDAVLASAKTVATDNMTMGLPDPALRAARAKRGQSAYPLRVLLTNSGRIDPALRLFQHTFSPIVLFSTTRMPARVRQSLAGQADLWLHDAADRKPGRDARDIALGIRREAPGVRRRVADFPRAARRGIGR